MPLEKRARTMHDLFQVGVVLKGLNALIELVLGTALLFVNVGAIVESLAASELIEDPDDFLATHAQQFISGHLSLETQYYAALYLISHGIIKGVLVYGLLRDRLWAFPASIAVLTLFIAYQSLRWLQTHSMALLLLTLFDLIVLWLIWDEYRRVKSRAQPHAAVVQ